MNISTHVSRLVRLAAALVLASLMASPAAAAGDAWYRDAGQAATIGQPTSAGDAWYRDAGQAAIDQSSVTVFDDWYRTSNPVAGDLTAVVAGDDWSREAPASPLSVATSVPVDAGPQVTPGGFDWGDFGIGAASTVGALALLAMLAFVGRAIRHGSRTLGRV